VSNTGIILDTREQRPSRRAVIDNDVVIIFYLQNVWVRGGWRRVSKMTPRSRPLNTGSVHRAKLNVEPSSIQWMTGTAERICAKFTQKTRNPLKFAGVPQTNERSQPLVGRSSPYYEDMWRRYCCYWTADRGF